MAIDLIPHLREAIASAALHYRAHPLRFLSEGDLKALVFNELATRIDGPYGVTTGDVNKHGHVHCDWPHTARKFDVAVADTSEEDWHSHVTPPVKIGILTRLWMPKAMAGIGPDLEKLRQAALARRPADVTGLLIVFCHPEVQWKAALGVHHFEEEATFPRNGIELHVIDSKGWHAAMV
jgi:hypothetical protein